MRLRLRPFIFCRWAVGAVALMFGLMSATSTEAAAHRHAQVWRRSTAHSAVAPHRPRVIVPHRRATETTSSKHRSVRHRTRLALKRYSREPAARVTRRNSDHHLFRAAHSPVPRPLIVVDPGHGGKDGGTVGPSGTLEKNVTLSAARELRRLLLATGRYRVVLTRTDDRYVSLGKRLALASARDVTLAYIPACRCLTGSRRSWCERLC
jgi:N-acetylmuramoyl-L-alanine amidase